jgi:hypothetical protein
MRSNSHKGTSPLEIEKCSIRDFPSRSKMLLRSLFKRKVEPKKNLKRKPCWFQCSGSADPYLWPVLRIRDVYRGSEFFPSWIPPSLIRIKEFKYFNPKKWFLSSRNIIRVVHPWPGSWLFTQPGSRGQKGTGSGSVTLPLTNVSGSGSCSFNRRPSIRQQYHKEVTKQ